MIEQMAIAIAFPGFNVLGCLVTPIFSFDRSFSTDFLSSVKKEQNLFTRSLKFLQNAPMNFILFSSSFICATVLNAS